MPPLTFGPPSGVLNTTEPYDDDTAGDLCQDASNIYFRDPTRKSGPLARPGFTLQNSGAALAGIGESAIHTHVDPATGTSYRFYAAGGKLYRANVTNSTFTDVTPTGTAIDGGSLPFSMVSVGSSLVCHDGFDRPWIAGNLSSTPITRTYIDLDGLGGAWSAYGPPTVYQDSVFFITATVPGGSAVQARVGIVWCEPNQPGVGYVQSGYADFWNIIETGSDPLYAIWGTNNGLFYWREQSIGVAAGTPSINFSTTATRDSKSGEVGTTAPWAIAQYGNYLYFLDLRGRPYRMALGGDPVPLWEQFPAVIAAQVATDYPSLFAITATAAIVPNLNQYLVAIWTSNPTSVLRPTIMYAFDAATGVYAGSWALNPAAGIVRIGITRDINNANVLALIAGITAGTSAGYVWLLSSVAANNWQDNGAVPVISVTTDRMGYNATNVYNADTATFITLSQAPNTVTVQTPYTTSTVEATAAVPNASSDGTYRTVIGLDVRAARGMVFTISPTTATSQWGFQRIEVPVVASLAGPEDQ